MLCQTRVWPLASGRRQQRREHARTRPPIAAVTSRSRYSEMN